MAKTLGELPIRKTIEIPFREPYREMFGDSLTLAVVAKGHPGYPQDSVTLIADKLMRYMPLDGKESRNIGLNTKLYGYNKYTSSNWHQWANSNALAGAWFSPLHDGDEPPTKDGIEKGLHAYDELDGFLRMLPDEFVNALLETSLLLYNRKTKCVEPFTAKVFLPSVTEVGLESDAGVDEGLVFRAFEVDGKYRVALRSKGCIWGAELKLSSVEMDCACNWFLRSPDNNDNYLICTGSNGRKTTARAFSSSVCVRPVVNIPSTMQITNIPNSNGHYELCGKTSERLDFDIVGPKLSARPTEAYVRLDRINGSPMNTRMMLCNNVYDAQPVWELSTGYGTHTFKNRSKEGGAWGVGIRVVAGPDESMQLRMREPAIAVRCEST